MNYESWRISFQSSEQAARTAFESFSSEFKKSQLLEDEIKKLKGLEPELPPYPPSGEGLPRYCLRWNGPTEPLSTPFDDGYWTPWHLADVVRQERDQLKVVLEVVTNELESWKATEEDPDSIRAIKIGKQAINDCKGLSLAEHDAEVIEQIAKELKEAFPHHTGVYAWLIGFADELLHKAQEPSISTLRSM